MTDKPCECDCGFHSNLRWRQRRAVAEMEAAAKQQALAAMVVVGSMTAEDANRELDRVMLRLRASEAAPEVVRSFIERHGITTKPCVCWPGECVGNFGCP